MSSPLPRISIITPCLNRRAFVAEAVESVLAQDYPDFEHIVMDGGSTDGTLEVLAGYPHLKVVSGPDDGLYDAINKGVARASGEVIGLLNTDDLFAPGALGAIGRAFADNPSAGMVSGGADIFEDGPDGRQTVHHFPGHSHGPLTLERITGGAVIFNARFFRKELFLRAGGLDPRYPVAGDRDFLLRVYRCGPGEAVVGRIVYLYRQHAGSLTIQARNPQALKLFGELMDLSGSVVDDASAPAPVRAACRAWHDRLAVDAAIHALSLGRPGRAAGFAARGMARRPAWPGVFVWQVARKAVRRLAGGRRG